MKTELEINLNKQEKLRKKIKLLQKQEHSLRKKIVESILSQSNWTPQTILSIDPTYLTDPDRVQINTWFSKNFDYIYPVYLTEQISIALKHSAENIDKIVDELSQCIPYLRTLKIHGFSQQVKRITCYPSSICIDGDKYYVQGTWRPIQVIANTYDYAPVENLEHAVRTLYDYIR